MDLARDTGDFWKAKADQFDGNTREIRAAALKTMVNIALKRGDALGDAVRAHLRKSVSIIVTTAALPVMTKRKSAL